MIIRKCDRCGCEISETNEVEEMGSYKPYYRTECISYKDLCKECASEWYAFRDKLKEKYDQKYDELAAEERAELNEFFRGAQNESTEKN